MITYNLLDKYNNIAHFCTDREGGTSMGNYASFNLSPYSGDQPLNVAKNQRLLCDKFSIDSQRLIIPYQTHGSEILEIDNSFFQLTDDEKSNALNGIDALITQLANVCIGVFTADCVPLIFYDPSKQVIAVAHAGWRGTCARIAEKTVRTMIDKYDCQPSTIRTVIGPSISAKVYEIGQEVADHFESAGFDISAIITTRNHSLYLDLWGANRLSLEKAGVLSEHIEVSGICTFTEQERFFSARRLGIKSGRMLSGIMLKGG